MTDNESFLALNSGSLWSRRIAVERPQIAPLWGRRLGDLPAFESIRGTGMSDFENRTYYRSRQHQEEADARAAAGPVAKRIHEDLAARYEACAGAAVRQEVEQEPRATAA